MDAELAVNQILDDEGLTSDLEEAEATLLTNWLIDQVKTIANKATNDEDGWKKIKAKRQQARKIAKAVALFRDKGPAEASQYAQQEHLAWSAQPPTSSQQIMKHLLTAAQ